MQMFNKRGAFRQESGFARFLMCILISGLGYGLYKGVLDNFLAEIVGMTEMDRGVMEFFRELPGVMLVLVLAVFYMFSAETLFKAGAVGMFAGMTLLSVLPASKALMIMTLFLFSFGEHVQLGMKSNITLSYAHTGRGGEALGAQNAANQIGTLAGYLAVVGVFAFAQASEGLYRAFFAVAAVLMAAAMVYAMGIRGKSQQDETKRRFYFHKKYTKYYMLEMFYGARKQVFFTFGPYVLILFYGANAATISLLFALSAIACFFTSPIVGRIIDKMGYKTVMVADTIILVGVCLLYGFAHKFLPMNVAFIVCCANYILDAIISQASMASNVYVQELSTGPDEVKATISTGVSINHLITIFIALFGGWIWQALGMELLFILSAVLGLCNSAYAATINVKKEKA